MSKNKFFAAIFALRIYRFALIPNAGLGHAHAGVVAPLALRICRLSSIFSILALFFAKSLVFRLSSFVYFFYICASSDNIAWA